MENKKTKLTISGNAKKSLSNIELAKTKSKNSVLIEKKNKFHFKSTSNKPFVPRNNTLSKNFNKNSITHIQNIFNSTNGAKNWRKAVNFSIHNNDLQYLLNYIKSSQGKNLENSIVHKIINFLLISTFLLLINSCAYFRLKELDEHNFTQNNIYDLVSKEYKEFAYSELYEMHDELDANYFAFKANNILKTKIIRIENPKNWKIPDKKEQVYFT